MHVSSGRQLHRLARRACGAVLLGVALGVVGACRPARDDAAAGTPDTPAASPAVLDDADVTILDTIAARHVVAQCSRPGPGPVSGYWVPTRADVAEADAAVLRALAAVASGRTGPVADTTPPRYVRQYAGLVRGTARVLYVNGVARDAIRSQADTTAWRRFAQSACDGGTMFFGAEYDAATGRVGALHFNGPG